MSKHGTAVIFLLQGKSHQEACAATRSPADPNRTGGPHSGRAMVDSCCRAAFFGRNTSFQTRETRNCPALADAELILCGTSCNTMPLGFSDTSIHSRLGWSACRLTRCCRNVPGRAGLTSPTTICGDAPNAELAAKMAALAGKIAFCSASKPGHM